MIGLRRGGFTAAAPFDFMKKLVAMFLVATLQSLSATDFPPALAGNTVALTILSATTNATSSTFDIEKPVYHTFQLNYTCTGTATNTLDYSLDGTNWVAFHTNELTAASITITTLTGKFKYVRSRFVATNATATVLYLGQ